MSLIFKYFRSLIKKIYFKLFKPQFINIKSKHNINVEYLSLNFLLKNNKVNKDLIFSLMSNYEGYSYSNIKQTYDWFELNSDVRWFANCIGNFKDQNITKFYLNNKYSKATRWDLWNNLIPLFKQFNIKSNLDIGCANNHFSFLCNKEGIFSLGIDPRENCISTSEYTFKRHFGNNRYAYVGNISTFVDYFAPCNKKLFDCVSILNFLHGANHNSDEIQKLFMILQKISSYVLLSEPKWDQLKLSKMTENY